MARPHCDTHLVILALAGIIEYMCVCVCVCVFVCVHIVKYQKLGDGFRT
jgi:hypothetical protein